MIKSLFFAKQLIPFCPVTSAVANYYGVEVQKSDKAFKDSENSLKTSDPSDVWDLQEKLSEGGFSLAYKVKHRQDDTVAAAKIIFDHENNFELFINEFNVLRRTNHKNIVRMIEAYNFNSELWVRII